MSNAVVSRELLAEIQGFYARQVQAMDNGRFGEFAETFAEDCDFTPMKHQPTAHGRQAIVVKLADFAKQVFQSDEQRRHWMSMSVVDQVEDATYDVISYAMVTNTKAGDPPRLHFAGEIIDRLVRIDGALLVQRRTVNSDSIA